MSKYKWDIENMKPFIRNCIYCKIEFQTYDHGKIYCSKSCAYNQAKIRAREKARKSRTWIPEIKKCPECKSLFTQSIKNQKYCKSECRELYYNKLKNFECEFPEEYHAFLKLRFETLKRDNFQCQYCGRSPKMNNCILHVDHIIPKIKGGTNHPSNLITSCKECNLGKKDVLLEERSLNKLENVKNEN